MTTVFQIHDRMGEKLVLLGGVLRCKSCGYDEPVGRAEDVAWCLRDGWPEHCGQTMVWVTERQLKAEAAR